jgi:hypothetical protein
MGELAAYLDQVAVARGNVATAGVTHKLSSLKSVYHEAHEEKRFSPQRQGALSNAMSAFVGC